MKYTVVDGYDVALKCEFGEYNCGNKTVGRLSLEVTKKGQKFDGGVIGEALEKKSIQDKILKNFFEWINDGSTYKSLKEGLGNIWPTDSGHYTPGVLIYADRIAFNKGFRWWNNWKGLIKLFEDRPELNVVVIKSPILPNKFYGTGAPSRVWTIVLPSISKHVCLDGKCTPEMKASLKSVLDNYADENLAKEIKAMGIK